MEMVKRSVDARVQVERAGQIRRSTEDFQSSETALYGTITLGIYHHTFDTIQSTPPRVNPNVKYQLWFNLDEYLTLMFTDYNKCTLQWGMLTLGKACIHCTWEISVPFVLLCCEPKTVLKSFSFSIIPSKEHPGLISSRMDWFDLLAVQGTLKSLLQYHSSKASILWFSAFYIVQLSHPYMTTGKTIALTRQTFVNKVMLLFLNMLSRLVIAIFPKSKHLLISWLQSPSPVIFSSVQFSHSVLSYSL